MNTISFYYFSGTGNSQRVAQWFQNETAKKGVTTQLYDIAKISAKPPIPEKDELIGFISPTHGFNYPPILVDFLFRFPRAKYHNKVILMNTRGGMKMSKIFLPGYSGIALWLAALILIIKGYKIQAMRSIDLPSNWQSLHPGLTSKVIQSMFSHYEVAVRTFAQKIIDGKRIFKPSLVLGFPVDIAILPVAIIYYALGRFILAKTFMASKDCDNCGLCIKNCPVKAISLVSNRPFWSYKCESCMRCMENCHKRAIETAHGYLTIVMVLVFILLMPVIYYIIPSLRVLNGNGTIISLTRFIIESVLCFFILISSYRLVHYLKKYKWFDVLVTYTSFTKLWFWRRYKAPRA